MTAIHTALALWVQRLEVRSLLTEQDRATIMGFPGTVRDYRSSRDIVHQHTRTSHVSLVVEGVVARFGQTPSASRQLTAFFIVGDMADLHSAVMSFVSAPLQSASRATIYAIEHEHFRAAAERSPTLARAFWKDCVADGQVAAEWLVNLGCRSAQARLAHLLCELAMRYQVVGYGDGRFPLHITQSQLGEALGLTGVHVNRMLRVLRSKGLLQVVQGEVRIIDWHGLRTLAEFDPAYLHLSREPGE